MKQIRVLQLIDSLNIGGAEMMAVNIANGLFQQGVESHLCVTRKEGTLKKNLNKDVGYLSLNRSKVLDISAIVALRRYVLNNKINTIHAHSTSSFTAFCVKIITPKIKIIWHDHFGNSEFLEQRKACPLNIFSFFFAAIIVVNKKLKIWSKQKLYCKNISIVNNFAFFNDNSKVTFLKGKKDKRIVHLAGFREQKDHLTLLKAFKIVLEKFPDWTLHLVGKEYDDSYSEKIHKYIHEKKLSESVFLYGVCSDIKHVLSQGSIGVLSSKSEGLPVSILEYGLANLPVVCTNVGDCSSVVAHNFSGYVVPSKNSKELAFYLSKLAESKDDQIRFVDNLNHTIGIHFSDNAAIKSIINIYYKCF